jgi:hypothetical protein
MSNIFQPLVRSTGGVIPLNIGVGELVDPIKNQHLNLDDTGAVYAISNGTIQHYGAGLPFDVFGRLVVSAAPKIYVDQSIPFTALNSVAIGGVKSYVSQGIAYDADGLLATS